MAGFDPNNQPNEASQSTPDSSASPVGFPPKKRNMAIIIGAIVAILVVGGVAIGGWIIVNNETPRDSSQPADSITAAPSPAEYSYLDASLARQMVIYNQQAIELATAAKQEVDNRGDRTFMEAVATSHEQTAETYIGWLKEWGESYMDLSDFPRIDGHDAYPTIGGMATVAEIETLSKAPPDRKIQKFFRLILRHHKGGLDLIKLNSENIQDENMKEFLEKDRNHYESEINYIQSSMKH